MARRFIKGAIKRPGHLRHYAEHEGCLNPDGTINLDCARTHAMNIKNPQQRLHRIREINLAHTLSELHHAKGTKSMEKMK